MKFVYDKESGLWSCLDIFFGIVFIFFGLFGKLSNSYHHAVLLVTGLILILISLWELNIKKTR